MNKILIIGHSSESSSQTASWMSNFGMSSPLCSRREGLFPTEITQMICKAHQVPRITLPTEDFGFNQITAGKAWYEFASDLLLSNSTVDLWGWHDPQALFLLDYWNEMDSKMAFIFVYDEPQKALSESANPFKNGDNKQKNISDILDNWMAYNSAMLQFHQSHPEKCLLVHSKRITESPYDFYESMKHLLGDDIPTESFTFREDARPSLLIDSEKLGSEAVIRNMLRVCTIKPEETMADLLAEPTESFFAELLSINCTKIPEFYSELQACANLPWFPPNEEVTTSVDCAWSAFVKQRMQIVEIIGHVHNERIVFLSQLHAMQDQLEKEYLKENQSIKPLDEQAAPKLEPNPDQEENHLAEESTSQQKPAPMLGAADRVKAQLSYRLGNALVCGARTPAGWIGMPMAIARECRLYKLDRKSRDLKKLPPLGSYADAHEAVRVKQQLSYRIGSSLVRHGRTPLGWCMIPLAIVKDMRAFNKSKVNKEIPEH